STERMPNEYIRPLDSSVFQCGVYLADPKRARIFRAGIAPSDSGMVISANLSKFCDFRLNEPPIERVPCAHDHDGGAPCTYAIEMNSIATYVDQFAKRSEEHTSELQSRFD